MTHRTPRHVGHVTHASVQLVNLDPINPYQTMIIIMISHTYSRLYRRFLHEGHLIIHYLLF